MLSEEASSIIIFWVFGMTQPGIEPSLPGYWRTLPIRPIVVVKKDKIPVSND